MKDVTIMSLGHKIFSLSMVLFTMVYIALIQQIPLRRALDLAEGGSARLFPWMLGVALLTLLVFDYVSTLIKGKKEAVEEHDDKVEKVNDCCSSSDEDVELIKQVTKEEKPAGMTKTQGAMVLILAASILVYQLLIGFIGFIYSTGIFLFVLFRIFGVKSWILNIVMSIVFPLVFYLVFETLFGVRLDFMRL